MTWLTPWVGAIAGIVAMILGGCRTNRTPFHSQMTRTEMRQAVEERFAIGMTWDEVVSGVDKANANWHREHLKGDMPYAKGIVTGIDPPGTRFSGWQETAWLTFVFDDRALLWDVYYRESFAKRGLPRSGTTGSDQYRLFMERVKP